MLISMLQGLSMSLADSVPGVSGGTIAFILGFYEKFLGALHDLIGKDRNLRRSAFLYLLKFSAGLGFARYKIKRIKDRSEIENAPSPSESEESQSEKCDISGGQDDAKPDNSCETENNDANQGEE